MALHKKVLWKNYCMTRLSNFFHYLFKRIFKKYLKLWGKTMGHDPGQNYFPVCRGFWFKCCKEKAPVVLTHTVHFKVNRFKYRDATMFKILSVHSVYVMPNSFKEGIFSP